MESNPSQAELFRHFQSYVWEDESYLHDLWSNAFKALEVMGAKPTNCKTDNDPEADSPLFWEEYLFPDGSIASILSDGSGVDYPFSDCGAFYEQFSQEESSQDDSTLRPDGTHSTQKDLDDINF